MNPVVTESNVTTRDGAPVMLFAYFGEQERCYHGAWFAGETWMPCTWDRQGVYNADKKTCGLDLMIKDIERKAA